MTDIYFSHSRVVTCASDEDQIPAHFYKQLSSLRSTKPEHSNLCFDGPDYDSAQEEKEGDVNDVDDIHEPLDPDGAGADVPTNGLVGDDEGDLRGDREDKDDVGGDEDDLGEDGEDEDVCRCCTYFNWIGEQDP